MRLAFKRYGIGYKEREVPIEFNILTLKNVSKELGVEFWELSDIAKKNNFDFMCELMYQGYVSACKERYQKPQWTKTNAIIWYENISKTAEKELAGLMADMFGDIKSMADKKKVTTKRHGDS